MWFKGTKFGVSIWYVCWGLKGESYNAELYQTTTGLKMWLVNPSYRDMSIFRIGRVVITEDGPVEKEHWDTREEFLKWYPAPLSPGASSIEGVLD